MKIDSHPSPNFAERNGQDIDMLVLHYTGMKTPEGALAKMCDPTPGKRVSAHYMVEEDGKIWALVPEEKTAWHAGKSFWRGHTNINDRSVGIEIVNPGHEYGYRPFPPAQMEAVAALSQKIIKTHAIVARNVVGHSDIAPERKEDPGELFDWAWLAEQGVGLWPAAQSTETPPEMLATYGYDLTHMESAVIAFQRHFRPELLTGRWDSQCAGKLASLLSLL